MLINDEIGAEVKTLVSSGGFPKGTKGKIITCAFLEGTTTRAYCIQSTENIKGLVEGPKALWFLERDLKNI